MIETPYDLDAVRALDDVRLIQFLELVYTFGPRVAMAWLAMCNGWRNDRIEGRNETSPGWNRGSTVTLAFDRGATRQEPHSQARSRIKAPGSSTRRLVH